MRKNIPNARERILKAAVRVFADKSFEGSRVDEIAAEAGVPKSLIYYHFKSKEEILDVLIEDSMKRFHELLQVAKDDTHQTKAEALSGRMQQNIYTQFLQEKGDIMRILLIESLMKKNSRPRVFEIAEELVKAEESFAIVESSNIYDRNERLVAEFFTNIIPSIAYTCFHQRWSDYFNILPENLERLFIDVFIHTHGAYHKYHE